MAVKARPQRDRFMEKVEMVPWSGCWIWTANVDPRTGYGRFFDLENRKADNAHRLAYRMFIGAIAPGLHVCHTCKVSALADPTPLTNNASVGEICRLGRIYSR
jgi:hypothetical protein